MGKWERARGIPGDQLLAHCHQPGNGGGGGAGEQIQEAGDTVERAVLPMRLGLSVHVLESQGQMRIPVGDDAGTR